MPNFCGRILDASTRAGDRTAIERVASGGLEVTTYRVLAARTAAAAAWLAAAHVGPGDRVAVLADNDANWIVAYLAILWRGAIAVPLDTAYAAAQVTTVLQDSGAVLLCTTPRHDDTARAAAGVVRLVWLDEMASCTGPAPPLCERADSDTAVMLYTSGTTADPKGVVLTHANLEAERASVLAVIAADDTDAVLGVLPLFHALAQMANLLLPLSIGARVVFLESVNSTSLLDALQTRGITLFACVPQFFYLIHQRVMADISRRGWPLGTIVRGAIAANGWLRDRLHVNPGRLLFGRAHRALGASMRTLITGGSRFDPAIGRDLYGMGFTLLNAYGLTETSGAATIQRPGDRFTTSVGQPIPGVEIRTLPREGPAGAAQDGGAETADGEILIRGPVVMTGYFNRPDATREALRDGWLRTGDLGWIDSNGRLYITGRLKEIIVLSSGKNLYPEELEAHYRRSTFVKEIAVLGMTNPDQPSAERLHAVVVPDDQALRDRGTVNVRELIRFELESLAAQLPAHKRVLSYDVWLEPLPRTSTGKLKRGEIARRVREQAAARHTERPLTADEVRWLAVDGHAGTVDAIARDLGQAHIQPDANLDLDLGLDSMERVELLTRLERAAGRHVTDDVRATIFTVRQLVDALERAPTVQSSEASAAESITSNDLSWQSVLSAPPDAVLAAELTRSKWIRAVVVFTILRATLIVAKVLWRFRVRGVEHVPREGCAILCPNHQSYLDAFAVVAALPFGVFRRVFLVGAAEYFQSRSMAFIARAINIVPVDPDSHLVRAMQAGALGLNLNKVLVLFPEGERTIDGQLRPFKKGAAILSVYAQAPLVPVAIDGMFELWPRARAFNWRRLVPGVGRPVTLRFGAPIPGPVPDPRSGSLPQDAASHATATLQAAVSSMLESPG